MAHPLGRLMHPGVLLRLITPRGSHKMTKQRISAVSLLVATMGLSLSAPAGNGAPRGPHYHLNIPGKTPCSGHES